MVGYNGVVNGYFKGKRGLRQIYPLSNYLFVIAMNCLSMMLNQAAQNEKIKYHNRCDRMKLTHLSFADDLLIFIDGSLSSVQNVLQVLKERVEIWPWSQLPENKLLCFRLIRAGTKHYPSVYWYGSLLPPILLPRGPSEFEKSVHCNM